METDDEKTRAIIGICLILIGFFWDSIKNSIPNIPAPNIPILNIPRPDLDTLENVSSIANLVTDKDDGLRLAIFNMVFSERVKDWNCNSQQINDIYVLAAQNEFGTSLAGKYDGYAEGIEELFGIPWVQKTLLLQKTKNKTFQLTLMD